MFECRIFITVKEIGEVLGVSESKSFHSAKQEHLVE